MCYVPVESHTPAVAVVEGTQFSVWDLKRSPTPIACDSFSQQTLFAVTSCDKYIATAGVRITGARCTGWAGLGWAAHTCVALVPGMG